MHKLNISKKVSGIPPSGIREFFDLVLGMEDIISLGIGEPDFTTPWNICESAIYGIGKGFTSYTSNIGLESLRKAIVNYIKKKYHLNYSYKNEILITVGVSEGYDLAIRALIDYGDEVLIPEPCYVSYWPIVYLAGGIPKYISTRKNGFKLSAELIEKNITKKTKAIVINYPSNPTGISYKERELKKLAKVFAKKNIWVISDEIYGNLTYDFEHIPFSTLPNMKKRTVYLNGFSKYYAMTGWRIGYACGPENVIDAMNRIHQYSMLCAPIMSQIAAKEAILNGEQAANQSRQEYKRRRDYVVERLNEMETEFIYPEGAFYIFMSVKKTLKTSIEFAKELLKEKKVAVVPGEAFGPSGKDFVRISYTVDFNSLKDALSRLQDFLRAIL
jgi:aminotransferase